MFALALLSLLCLFLLLASPARAQWAATDENGSPLNTQTDSASGFTGLSLHATETGTVTTTLPPGSTVPVSTLGNSWGITSLGVGARNGMYQGPSGWVPANGTTTGTAKAHLEARFRYTGPLPAPPYLDLLLRPSARASASTTYWGTPEGGGADYYSGLTSGLTASASVSLSLTLNAAAPTALAGATASALFADQPRTAGGPNVQSAHEQTVSTPYLLRVPVVGGVARVALDGQMLGSAANPIVYGIRDNPYYTRPTNGPTSASSYSSLSALIRQAGPPKSILINRPENAGANIEADQKIFDFATGEWTCYGDSRFDNAEITSIGTPGGGSVVIPTDGTVSPGDETWQASPIGSPWPPQSTFLSGDSFLFNGQGDWDRHWHWYAEAPASPPATTPTSLGYLEDWTSAISDFTPPSARPHRDWPYVLTNQADGFVANYAPHDLLDEMQSSTAPARQINRINLHLTDYDLTHNHPDYELV